MEATGKVPEVPLSDVVDSCAVDALIVNLNRNTPPEAWDKSLWNNFIGKLAEATFAAWTGIPRKRPRFEERRDCGDVDFGGSVKGAQAYHEVPNRKDQNWSMHSWEMTEAQWIVFVAVEMRRDLGLANALQVRLGRTDLSFRRWVEDGRRREPVGTIWGWATPAELEDLKEKPNERDGLVRPSKSYTLVNWRKLRAWPDHPHPTHPRALHDLLGIGATEGERTGFMDSMRNVIRKPEDES